MKNLKHLLLIPAIAYSTFTLKAQDKENELKNFRFGLKVTPSVNWYKTDGKIISGNGAGVKIGGGLVLEFRLAKVASIQTGVQIDLDGGKIKYANGGIASPGANTVTYYYSNSEDAIEKYDDSPNSSTDSITGYKWNMAHTQYQLNERQYKVTYVTIPFTLKMKTKEIGIMTYYGQVGLNTSFRYKAKANDKVTSVKTGGSTEKTNVDITKDVSVINESLNIGFGAEMNLAGSTSLTFGLNYLLGFTNVVKNDSKYLLKRTNDPDFSSSSNPTAYSLSGLSQKLKSNVIVLSVGVLF